MTLEAVLAENLSVAFAGSHPILALSDVSLRVPDGALAAIIGPSGCGKSTLLRAIGGFLPTASGRLESFGKPIVGASPDRAILFQSDSSFPWKTAIENIAFAAQCRGLAKQQAVEEARLWLRKVGLKDYERLYPAQLSGGMEQRVALARTFASAARILLLDEPFHALDRITRSSLWDILLSLWAERNATILLVTHDVEEALALADFIVVMQGQPGRILAIERVTEPRVSRTEWLFTMPGIDARRKINNLLVQQ